MAAIAYTSKRLMLHSIRLKLLGGPRSSSQSCRNGNRKAPSGSPLFPLLWFPDSCVFIGKIASYGGLWFKTYHLQAGISAMLSESNSTALWDLLLLEFGDYKMISWFHGYGLPSALSVLWRESLVWCYVVWDSCQSENLAENKKQSSDTSLLIRHSIALDSGVEWDPVSRKGQVYPE